MASMKRHIAAMLALVVLAPAASRAAVAPTPAPTPAADAARSCSANSDCESLGITGLCCPSLAGKNLDCCDDADADAGPVYELSSSSVLSHSSLH